MSDGVYEFRRGTDVIHVIVVNRLPQTENNAVLHLLSAAPEQVRYGVSHYEQRSEETSSLLDRIFEGYEREGVHMPYTMEDFRREYLNDHIKMLSPEERLRGLSLEERLRGWSPEEILRALSGDERLRDLSDSEIKKLLQHKKLAAARKRPRKKK